MVDINIKDFNLQKIGRMGKLFNLVTKNYYRIYGLKNVENPPILLEVPYSYLKKATKLNSFLVKNNIKMEYSKCSDKNIYVGLRRDLRKDIILSACILQTVIYHLEGRLNLKTIQIPGIPKFE